MRLINLASFEAIQKNISTAGVPEKLSAYYQSNTIGFTLANGPLPSTITDSASQFLNKGFRAGDKVVVTGSTSNNQTYEILSVSAGTMVLKDRPVVEAAGNLITLDTVQGMKIEDGVSVVVRAKSTNTGVATLGPTSARALNTNTGYYSNLRLSAGQSVSLQVKNLNQIWSDVTVSADGLEIVFEK